MSEPLWLVTMVLALGLLYVVVPVVWHTYREYRDRRTVVCPETGTSAEVDFDARKTAWTAAYRTPKPEIRGCSLWPERSGCAQRCIED